MSGKQAGVQPLQVKPAAVGGLLQRKCACGQHTIAGGECEECKKKREGVLQRAPLYPSSSSPHPSEVPPIVHEVLRSPGQPLDPATRAFMEPRFGHDFSRVRVHKHISEAIQFNLPVSQPGDTCEQEADRVAKNVNQTPTGLIQSPGLSYDFGHVRIHTDVKAAESARAVDALAYTIGHHIAFGAGQYQPETSYGRQVLAHELVHIIQQDRNPSYTSIYRLSPAMCSSGAACATSDVAGVGPANSWNLTLAVDREEKGLGRLISGNVGHTWVKLKNNAGTKYSYGFWPQKGFNAKKPFSSVAGCVHHPDTAHEPPNATEYLDINYNISMGSFNKALSHAQSVCNAKPAYNLITYNCTTFAIDVAKAAGVTPPASTTLAVDNPNALYEGIEKGGKAGHPGTGALIGGLGGAALGIGIGSIFGPVGALVGGLIGGLGGLIGGTLIGEQV